MVGFNEQDKLAFARQVMIDKHLKSRNISDSRVLAAMGSIRREEFISEKYENQAYDDNPLPIGLGQTISQPYVVAVMTQELDVKPEHIVLEIGTGCGYQTAVLAKLVCKVYTIERFSQLAEMAQAVLGRIGINNVEFCIGDGSKGWNGQIQFDRILITAAAPQIPQPLIKQLKIGGKIITPIGQGYFQELIFGEKVSDNEIKLQALCGVRFVKLIGEYGYSDE